MFVRTDIKGKNARHNVAYESEQDVTQKVWQLYKYSVTTEELKKLNIIKQTH